jgi:hypothetical protein
MIARKFFGAKGERVSTHDALIHLPIFTLHFFQCCIWKSVIESSHEFAVFLELFDIFLEVHEGHAQLSKHV